MFTILLSVVWIFSLLVLGGVLLHTLAKNNILFTYPLTEQFTFIKRGEALHTILGIIQESSIKTGEVIPKTLPSGLEDFRNTNPKWYDKILWMFFRMQWVGIPGFRSIHYFEIEAKRMRSMPLTGNISLGEKLIEIDKEKKRIWSLRRRFVRPIVVSQVELPEDNAGIDWVIGGVFIIIKPSKPVFGLGGDFMIILEKAVSQAVMNACKKEYKLKNTPKKVFLSYKKLQSLEMGVKSPFVQGIIKEVNSGIEDQLGITLESLNIESWVADANTTSLANAQQGEELARAKGREEIAKAEALAKSTILDGEAQAQAFTDLAKAQAQRIQIFRDAGLTDKEIGVILANEALPKQITHFTSPGTVSVEGVHIGNNEGGSKP